MDFQNAPELQSCHSTLAIPQMQPFPPDPSAVFYGGTDQLYQPLYPETQDAGPIYEIAGPQSHRPAGYRTRIVCSIKSTLALSYRD